MAETTRSDVPRSIRLAQVLVTAEAIALLAAAVLLLVELAVSSAHRLWIALSLTALAVFAAAVLALCARGLGRDRYSARTPIVLTQLLMLPVGYGLLQAGRFDIGAPMMLAAVLVLAALFSASARSRL